MTRADLFNIQNKTEHEARVERIIDRAKDVLYKCNIDQLKLIKTDLKKFFFFFFAKTTLKNQPNLLSKLAEHVFAFQAERQGYFVQDKIHTPHPHIR